MADLSLTAPLALGLNLDATPPATAGVGTTAPLVLGLLLAEASTGIAATLNATDDNDTLVAVAQNWGVLGSTVPATGDDGPGLLYDEVVTYGYASNYVRVEILSVTSGYTLTVYPNTSFDCSGPPGICVITYRYFVDGVLQSGTGTATLDFAIFAGLGASDAADALSSAAVVLDAVAVSFARTDADDTLSSSATVVPVGALSASLDRTDDDDTLDSTVTVDALPGRTATLDVTDDDDTLIGHLLTSDAPLVSAARIWAASPENRTWPAPPQSRILRIH